ncbi:MAG: hypothetical protein J6T37_09770 [Bacteroidales bacterium]|nr:hypothetical protein [Bacteroidales bacterium]MBQ3843376.1 hypothetical protein [Bacteroidales bacterium]
MMEKRELSKDEIIGLIGEFKSEVRKNLAKIDFFNEKIEELTKLLGDSPNQIETKKEKTRKPYPLSKWDNIVLEVIRENGKPTTSKEIYDKAMAKAVVAGIAMDEIKMKSKINQCLVKLSGRRDDLKKIKYGGRGYAYAINL